MGEGGGVYLLVDNVQVRVLSGVDFRSAEGRSEAASAAAGAAGRKSENISRKEN